jgi:hypothetical protein
MDNYSLMGIVILIIFFILTILLSFFRKKAIDEITTVNQNTNSNVSLGDSSYQKCIPGYCVTSILNGIKRCPSDPKDSLSYISGLEVCNPEFFCVDKNTPYALTTTGEVNVSGECETGIRCRCINEIRSPYYSTVYFTAENGNPYSDKDYILVQTQIEDAQKNPGKVIFKMPENTFYKLNPAVLNRLEGGCDFKISKDIKFINNSDYNSPDQLNMMLCLSKENNPCLSGQMMYNIDNTNPRNFTNFYSKGISYLDDPMYYTLGCSIGGGCYLEDTDQSKYFPDYDDKAFNVVYNNLTLPSLYYPVFNPNTYRQECLKPKPFVLSKLNFDNNGNLKSVDVIYSSKDFIYVLPVFTIFPISFDKKQQFTVLTDIDGRVTSITPINTVNYIITEQLSLRISSLITK